MLQHLLDVEIERLHHQPLRSSPAEATHSLHEDAGPGLVLAVDADTWEEVDIALDDPIVETGNGYRYDRLNADGTLTFTRVS